MPCCLNRRHFRSPQLIVQLPTSVSEAGGPGGYPSRYENDWPVESFSVRSWLDFDLRHLLARGVAEQTRKLHSAQLSHFHFLTHV
jgi:hypothetical protein